MNVSKIAYLGVTPTNQVSRRVPPAESAGKSNSCQSLLGKQHKHILTLTMLTPRGADIVVLQLNCAVATRS